TKGWYNQFEQACEVTTLPNGSSSGTFYRYGSFMAVTDKKEYDYGVVSPSACPSVWLPTTPQPSATPTRETVVNYTGFGNSPIANVPTIYEKPCQMIVYGGGSRAAESDFFYDNGGVTTGCGVPGTPSVTGVGNLPAGTHDETNYGATLANGRGN